MPHTISWLVPMHVVYMRTHGAIDFAEYQQFDEQMVALLDQSDRPLVHILTNDRDVTALPSLLELRHVRFAQHPRLGWFVALNDNRVFRFITTIVGHIFKARYHFVNTPDEGLTFLTDMDATLPPLDQLRQRLAQLEQTT